MHDRTIPTMKYLNNSYWIRNLRIIVCIIVISGLAMIYRRTQVPFLTDWLLRLSTYYLYFCHVHVLASIDHDCSSISPQKPQQSVSSHIVLGASPGKRNNTNRQRIATALSSVNKARRRERERGNSPENHGWQTAEFENRLNFVEKRKEDKVPDLKQI